MINSSIKLIKGAMRRKTHKKTAITITDESWRNDAIPSRRSREKQWRQEMAKTKMQKKKEKQEADKEEKGKGRVEAGGEILL